MYDKYYYVDMIIGMLASLFSEKCVLLKGKKSIYSS